MSKSGGFRPQAQNPAAMALQAKFNQGKALHRQGRLAEAERIYGEVLRQQPNHFDALHLLGIIAAQTRRTERAIELIKKAIALNANVAGAHSNLGIALRNLKRPEEALASYDKAIALKPDFAEAYNNRGNALQDLKRPEDALASFDKAIALKANFAEACYNRGNALQELKRPEGALASYDKAIVLKADYAEAYNNRCNALWDLQRPEEALASCDKAIALKPDFAEAYNNRGNALRELKRPEEAVASYDRAIALKPDFAEAYNNRGNALWDLKRPEDALASYDRAIALKPDYAEAYCSRGTALADLQRPEDQLTSYDRAIALKPHYAEAYNNRGNALRALRRPEDALASFGKAIVLKPDYAEAYYNRGVTLQDLQRPEDALTSYDEAIALKPHFAETYNNRGNALQALKRPEDALASYGQAIALKPDYAEAYNNRGIALQGLKRLEDALASYGKAIALKPDYAEAHYNRGNALHELKRLDEALVSYDRALSMRPDYAEALNNRGNALHELKRLDEALASYERALTLRPDNVEAHYNRGNVLHELKRYDEALASYDRALTLRPDYSKGLNNRGNALRELSRFEEALASYDRALAVKADHAHAFSGAADCVMRLCDWDRRTRFVTDLCAHVSGKKSIVSPFVLLGYSGDPALQLQCARNRIENMIPLPPPFWSGQTWRHDKLRVAYLSPDFRSHAVAFLTAELFELHDRSRFEIIGVSFGVDDRSEMRQRLIAAFDEFHDVRRNSDREVAKLLNDHHFDIAVDLAGYTNDSRPGILAHRPVPIQVSYLGFPATMGADFIDYIIADAMVLPVEQQPYYTEKVVYLPDCYQVNDTKRQIAERTPTRQQMGLPEHAFVFCCFNNNWKITPEIFDMWMRLLHQVESSVLWLLEDNEGAERNLRKEAQRRGIDPSRLVFAGRLPLVEHLARQRLAGLFVDTTPYNAGATAAAALWSGLPVLTVIGATFVGRMAASLLHAVGVPELITANLEDYQTLALKLAHDPALLAEIKAKLVRNRNIYPLFNTERFARNIEAAYTTMWETWQRGEAPKSFSVEPIDLAGSVGVAHASPISEISRHS